MDVKSEQDLQSLSNNNTEVVLHFWAVWCEPCKQMDVVLAELAKDFPAVKFGRVEAEEVDSLTEHYGVSSVPTFIFLRGPVCLGRLEGANPPALTAELKKHFGGPTLPASNRPAVAPDQASDVVSRIKHILSSHPVALFMKGSADEPRCGFSRKVVDALENLTVPFHTVDILQDPELREKLKEYSNWPTYPQLYIKGELVGGCDIVLEMQHSGELKDMVSEFVLSDGGVTKEPPPPVHHSAPADFQPQREVIGFNPEPQPSEVSEVDVKTRIESLLKSSPVLLFMKGSPDSPQCGFSRKVVEALQSQGIDFKHVDILKDDVVRQGLKTYSNWPTYPQLYANSQLVGGCDIILEMQANGELKSSIQELLGPQKEDLNTRLKQLVTREPVMVFMKGTPDEPRCGFSSRVVGMLRETGQSFGSFDILTDEQVRQGLKEFSNWPTYPQVFVKGELLGGCDIVTELHNNKELRTSIEEMLQESKA